MNMGSALESTTLNANGDRIARLIHKNDQLTVRLLESNQLKSISKLGVP